MSKPTTFEEWWENEPFKSATAPAHLCKRAWQSATAAERERCAKVAEDHPQHRGATIAAAIRKGK